MKKGKQAVVDELYNVDWWVQWSKVIIVNSLVYDNILVIVQVMSAIYFVY